VPKTYQHSANLRFVVDEGGGNGGQIAGFLNSGIEQHLTISGFRNPRYSRFGNLRYILYKCKFTA